MTFEKFPSVPPYIRNSDKKRTILSAHIGCSNRYVGVGKRTLGAMLGMLPAIEDHLAWAAVSLGNMKAVCQMGGNKEI